MQTCSATSATPEAKSFGRGESESRPAGRGRFGWISSPLGILATATSFAAICGCAVHPQALTAAGCLAAAILVGAVWPWINLRGVSVEVLFPADRSWEGEPIAARLRFRNRWPWPVDGVTWRLKDGSTSSACGCRRLPARSVVELPWSMVPSARGVFPRASITAATSFPFGLWEAERLVECPRPILVWAKRIPLHEIPPQGQSSQTASGPAASRRTGQDGETTGVREFRRGDSLRQVHWIQSARCDSLMVRELQDCGAVPWRIVLDADAEVHVGGGARSSVEWGLRIAAGLAERGAAQGARVEVVLGRMRSSVGGRRGDLERLRDSIARWTAPARVAEGEFLASLASPSTFAGMEWVVSTDCRWPREAAAPRRPNRIYVLLRAAGFGGSRPLAAAEEARSSRRIVWIDSPETAQSQLEEFRRAFG